MTQQDINQIQQHGSSVEIVEQQIVLLKNESLYMNLHKAATKPDDIIDLESLKQSSDNNSFTKTTSFIPASGAASRMFKALFEILNDPKKNLGDSENIQSPAFFFNNLPKLALFNNLKEVMAADNLDTEKLLEEKKYSTILEYLLTNKGIDLGNTPKALIPFHFDRKNNETHYAFEEHIVEAVNYLSNEDRNVHLHYTLSPEHIDRFMALKEQIVPKYEKRFNCRIHIQTSIQEPHTDTIALNPDNTLFRNNDGSIMFRPGGHGALIYNLNTIDSDVIIIKNIDNVVPADKINIIIDYRSTLINAIKSIAQRRNELLNDFDNGNFNLQEAETFVNQTLRVQLPQNYISLSEAQKADILKIILDRPIRICGMVKNTGEPGGGPFIVADKKGILSKQIVESSQVNHDDEAQEAIFKSSTHFNPVDLICMTKNHKGEKYDLQQYINNKASFISHKSKDGKPLKALELPGLWNGAMSGWNTIFVEVAIESFNPVKTINDLFRPIHS